jgi:hypothetical protein
MARTPQPIVAILALLACMGCGTDRLIQATPPGFRQDVFTQDAASRIDVLWVIDNSGSMQPRQEALAASLNRFMELFSRGLIDYRIAVTTTDVISDQGAFYGNPAIIDPSLPDPVAAFRNNVRVGTSGKGHEEGFEAALLAITREKESAAEVLGQRQECTDQCPAGAQALACAEECAELYSPQFMRPEAHLYIVFVSDEVEQSFGEGLYFQRFFESALGPGNEGAVSASAICGDVPTPPCQAEPGTRYVALAEATGGIVGSICDSSFDSHLERLALDAVGLKRKFSLAVVPDVTTLEIEVRYRCDTPLEQRGSCETLKNGCAGKGPEYQGLSCVPPAGEPNGWTWEASTNSVFFNGDSVPGLRSAIVVSYQSASGY